MSMFDKKLTILAECDYKICWYTVFKSLLNQLKGKTGINVLNLLIMYSSIEKMWFLNFSNFDLCSMFMVDEKIIYFLNMIVKLIGTLYIFLSLSSHLIKIWSINGGSYCRDEIDYAIFLWEWTVLPKNSIIQFLNLRFLFMDNKKISNSWKLLYFFGIL